MKIFLDSTTRNAYLYEKQPEGNTMNRKPLTGWAGFVDALAGAAILAAFIGGMLAIWTFKGAGL